MAIRMMCDPSTPGAVRDDHWSREGHEIWVVTTHVGLVLSMREANGYDDSDFYATFWNDEKGAPESIMYASTRGWTYPNGASVDATDEVKAKYAAYSAKLAAERKAEREAAEAAMPAKGKKAKTVRNVKGKHAIEAGVTGTIFWVGEDRFAKSYSAFAPKKLRVGFEAADGRKVFIAGDAVEVIVEAA
jgi:hypothetical protein